MTERYKKQILRVLLVLGSDFYSEFGEYCVVQVKHGTYSGSTCSVTHRLNALVFNSNFSFPYNANENLTFKIKQTKDSDGILCKGELSVEEIADQECQTKTVQLNPCGRLLLVLEIVDYPALVPSSLVVIIKNICDCEKLNCKSAAIRVTLNENSYQETDFLPLTEKNEVAWNKIFVFDYSNEHQLKIELYNENNEMIAYGLYDNWTLHQRRIATGYIPIINSEFEVVGRVGLHIHLKLKNKGQTLHGEAKLMPRLTLPNAEKMFSFETQSCDSPKKSIKSKAQSLFDLRYSTSRSRESNKSIQSQNSDELSSDLYDTKSLLRREALINHETSDYGRFKSRRQSQNTVKSVTFSKTSPSILLLQQQSEEQFSSSTEYQEIHEINITIQNLLIKCSEVKKALQDIQKEKNILRASKSKELSERDSDPDDLCYQYIEKASHVLEQFEEILEQLQLTQDFSNAKKLFRQCAHLLKIAIKMCIIVELEGRTLKQDQLATIKKIKLKLYYINKIRLTIMRQSLRNLEPLECHLYNSAKTISQDSMTNLEYTESMSKDLDIISKSISNATSSETSSSASAVTNNDAATLAATDYNSHQRYVSAYSSNKRLTMHQEKKYIKSNKKRFALKLFEKHLYEYPVKDNIPQKSRFLLCNICYDI